MNEKERRAAAEARNAYARRWRAANRDKVRANNERYWLRKAEQEMPRESTERKENNA